MTRYTLSAEDREKARSPEALERRRATLAANARERRELTLDLHRWGLVDGAIAAELGVSEDTIARWLVGQRVRPRYGRGVISS